MSIPEGARPNDWPSGWVVDGPSPPGWPKYRADLEKQFRFQLAYANDILTVTCFDQFNEDTDLMLGQLFEITAFCETQPVCRLKREEAAPWSLKALAKIREYERGKWGLRERLLLEHRPAVIRVDLFGYNPLLRAELAV